MLYFNYYNDSYNLSVEALFVIQSNLSCLCYAARVFVKETFSIHLSCIQQPPALSSQFYSFLSAGLTINAIELLHNSLLHPMSYIVS